MYVKVAKMEGTTEATCFIFVDLVLSGFRAHCALIWSHVRTLHRLYVRTYIYRASCIIIFMY